MLNKHLPINNLNQTWRELMNKKALINLDVNINNGTYIKTFTKFSFVSEDISVLLSL